MEDLEEIDRQHQTCHNFESSNHSPDSIDYIDSALPKIELSAINRLGRILREIARDSAVNQQQDTNSANLLE